MRNVYLALVVLAVASGYAAAAGNSSIAPGSGRATGCGAAVQLAYDVAYDASLSRYRISGVRVDGLGGCVRARLRIELSGGKTVLTLVHLVGPAEGRTGRATLAVDGHLDAHALRGVSIAIAR